MLELYEGTKEKTRYLENQGLRVIEKWECQLRKEMERDEEMRRYFEEYELVDPLQAHDGFYGGRTNATTLFYECQDDEEIR